MATEQQSECRSRHPYGTAPVLGDNRAAVHVHPRHCGSRLVNCPTSLHHCHGLEGWSTDLSPLRNLLELDISGSRSESIPARLTTCRSLQTLKMDECSQLWQYSCKPRPISPGHWDPSRPRRSLPRYVASKSLVLRILILCAGSHRLLAVLPGILGLCQTKLRTRRPTPLERMTRTLSRLAGPPSRRVAQCWQC